jgi:hydrogenase maturation protease
MDEIRYRIVVIGIGNLLMKDEGIGIHVIQELEKLNLPSNVKLIDGGTSPDLVAYLQAEDKVIIIDAAKAGGEPGAIYRFKPEDTKRERSALYSAHQLSLIESLSMAHLSGSAPEEVIIIGIEPKEIGLGMELSPKIRQKMPKIIEVVKDELMKKC